MVPVADRQTIRTSSPAASFFQPDLIATGIVAVAFLLRIKLASETFLNADEALHFMAANQPSWKLTYQASLTISHPPLLIFLLHLWRGLGNSELILRLPSVIAGTAFCWMFFKWLSQLFGNETALVGLIFAGFLPPLVALSVEIRQYALLLVLAICALHSLERALTENSRTKMLLSCVCLWLALGSHYSAVIFAASLGVYALVRMVKRMPARGVIAVWTIGQVVGLAVCWILYRFYVAAFGSRALHSWMDVYLHNSYFDARQHNAFVFVVARTASLFQYLFGQNVVGDLMLLVFVTGVVLVLRRTKTPSALQISRAELATLLLLPFAITCGLALLDIYPYGGTRHCVFLAIFAIAALSYAFSRVRGSRQWLAIASVGIVISLCYVFPSRRLPYIAGADQQKWHMAQALSFIQERIPTRDLLFVDNQTHLLLGHYLCQQRPFFINEWVEGFNTLECGGHRIIGTDGRVFTFTAANFVSSWNEMRQTYGLKPGDSVWIVQMGWHWEDPFGYELKSRYAEFHTLQIYSFGGNIAVFQFPIAKIPDRS
ncbi:MAG: glycosyltransferase family 39 protein [Acidobacteriaceae bacterium]|nr:glycosyltransferase family 39 protein [Acidobacteriaceae bacterium]